MTHTPEQSSSTSGGLLFDTEQHAQLVAAHQHSVNTDLPDDVSPVERILRNGLPVATKVRWQPLRVGLVNLYLFQDEVFPFADGRLLLRGDNGAGKSRVLALTLPLLLDGRLHPTRVEPDRDANRQVAWNLLMDEHQDRTGYTWIEFGRLDDDGRQHFLTLGLGMRGVRGRGITDHWMFVTSQRVGQQLSLITSEKRVLTKRLLQEAVGELGQVFESSTDYRRAVDEALFRLNERYDALQDLLLQLRQPQLAKKLDLDGLEKALREAMPPISPTLLSDAADAFRSLDQERETLFGLQQSRSTVQEFLKPYRRHLRLGIRRAAGRLRTRHSRFEQAGKELRDAEQQKQQSDAEVARVTAELAALAARQKATAAALQSLRADPAMKLAERLNTARQLHDFATEAMTTARSAADRVAREINEARLESEAADEEAKRLIDRATKFHEVAARAAVPQVLQRLHVERFESLLPDTSLAREGSQGGDDLQADVAGTDQRGLSDSGEIPSREAIDEIETQLTDRVAHWLRTGQHLAELTERVDVASEALRSAVRRLDDAQNRQQSAADQLVNAQAGVEAVRDTLWMDIERWHTVAASLGVTVPHFDELEDRWKDWARTLTGPSPAAAAADSGLRVFSQAIAAERSALQQRSEDIDAEQTVLNDEQQRLLDGEPIRPAPPLTRDPAVRTGRAGAPLWELIDFAPSVPHDERCGWEAALQASGLLDAWLNPDGSVVDAGTHDTILSITDDAIPDPDRRLTRVLSPSGDCRARDVAADVVTAVLDRVGAGVDGGRVWVNSTGNWRNGPLSGCWSKPIPQFIGSDVRAAYRERRLTDIAAELTRLVTESTRIEAQLAELQQRQDQADRHRDALLDDGSLRTAVAQRDAAEQQVNEARHHVREAAEHERIVRRQRDDAAAVRDSTARDVGLSDWAEKPSELLLRLETYGSQLANAVDACRAAVSAMERLQRCRDHEARKQTEQSDHIAQLRRAELTEAQRRSSLEELQQTVGADAKEITQRITDREAEQRQLELQQEQSGSALRIADKAAAGLEVKLRSLTERIQQEDIFRRDAAEGLSELVRLKLLPSADDRLVDVITAPASLTAAVDLARQIEKLSWNVADIDNDDAWKRSQTQIYNALEPLKGRLTSFNMNAEPEFVGENLCYVLIRHQAAAVTPDQLVKRLDAEVEEHERVLSENERQILEKHLLGEVAGEMHERMQQARELVESMNSEVSNRPMRTGMQMRFRWEVDSEGPAGLSAACQVLSTASATWSDDDRRELGDFLQQQIAVSREREDAGSRQEQLATALDYRRWHRFRIDRRSGPDQDWKPLTRRTYGSGSGGEKAIALTLPQVAAAAAYYRTADPLAPRLILMDEVFAGISSNNRAACMELLTAFELDVVMTSESEWGCYSTVPQLAICQLTRVPDLAAIDNTVFVWNGRECVESQG
ncbi:MAG: TIGR02680 family protein [Planctomycetaceae bacterium]